MVGDPQQLPPTVKCRAAQQLGLDTSLFHRLQVMGVAPLLLNVQVSNVSRAWVAPSAELLQPVLGDVGQLFAPTDRSNRATCNNGGTCMVVVSQEVSADAALHLCWLALAGSFKLPAVHN
jgi:hypothetical protein